MNQAYLITKDSNNCDYLVYKLAIWEKIMKHRKSFFFASQRNGNRDVLRVQEKVITIDKTPQFSIRKKITLLFFFIMILLPNSYFVQAERPAVEVTTLHTNLYKMSSGVNNWIALLGPDGVLLSDDAPEGLAKAIKPELKRLGSDKIKFIINTHWHHDHCGGNLFFGKDATIIAHHSVRQALSERQEISLFGENFKAYPEYALPDLTFSSRLKINFNGEEIEIIHMPNGHTEGDAIVYFRHANILHIGDLYISNHFPPIDYDHGGDVEQFAENLQNIIKAMPHDVLIISGHLEDGDISDLKAYHEMLISTVEIVRRGMMDGKSLEDMQRERILDEWKDWGKHVTCDMWIKTIFHCLRQKSQRKRIP